MLLIYVVVIKRNEILFLSLQEESGSVICNHIKITNSLCDLYTFQFIKYTSFNYPFFLIYLFICWASSYLFNLFSSVNTIFLYLCLYHFFFWMCLFCLSIHLFVKHFRNFISQNFLFFLEILSIMYYLNKWFSY